MRYWEFALTESQARKDYVTRQYKAALDALASSNQATSMGIGSTEQLIDWFYNLDPSSNKKYFSWIVDRVVSKTATETLDSIQGVKDLLTNFEEALRTQQQAGISVLDSNIGKYRSLATLDAAIQQVSSSKEADDLAEYNQARSESTMLHEDPTWAVAIPQTQEAAMYWTRGTTQCINWGDPEGLQPTRENRFDEYPGTYVIHNRRDPKQIVSIHFESNQIMNWEDKVIPREQWDNTNPFIRKVIDYHGKKLLAGSAKVSDLIGFAEFCFNGRWPEAESRIIEHENVHALVTYASEIIKDRWPEPDRARAENMIIRHGHAMFIVMYAKHCIKDRWPEPERARVENMIIESGKIKFIYLYARYCIEGRWPAVESEIASSQDVDLIIRYAQHCIKGRWPDPDRAQAENTIVNSGYTGGIIRYAQHCIKGRWPEAEHVIFSQGTILDQNQYRRLVQSSQGDGTQ